MPRGRPRPSKTCWLPRRGDLLLRPQIESCSEAQYGIAGIADWASTADDVGYWLEVSKKLEAMAEHGTSDGKPWVKPGPEIIIDDKWAAVWPRRLVMVRNEEDDEEIPVYLGSVNESQVFKFCDMEGTGWHFCRPCTPDVQVTDLRDKADRGRDQVRLPLSLESRDELVRQLRTHAQGSLSRTRGGAMTVYAKKDWESFATVFFIVATVLVSVFTLGMYFGMYVTMPEIDDQPRARYGYYKPVGDRVPQPQGVQNEEG